MNPRTARRRCEVRQATHDFRGLVAVGVIFRSAYRALRQPRPVQRAFNQPIFRMMHQHADLSERRRRNLRDRLPLLGPRQGARRQNRQQQLLGIRQRSMMLLVPALRRANPIVLGTPAGFGERPAKAPGEPLKMVARAVPRSVFVRGVTKGCWPRAGPGPWFQGPNTRGH